MFEFLKLCRGCAVTNADVVDVRIVGGSIRNAIIAELRGNSLLITDIDAVINLDFDQMIEICQKVGAQIMKKVKLYKIIKISYKGLSMDLSILRKDTKSYGRHADVECIYSFDEDSLRRDFTMNAIYMDEEGELYDPHGGIEDLKNKQVRFIGDAKTRILEDGLRLLRYFRMFSYLDTKDVTLDALPLFHEVAHVMDHISDDRKFSELMAILSQPNALCALNGMYAYGLLENLLGRDVDIVPFLRLMGDPNIHTMDSYNEEDTGCEAGVTVVVSSPNTRVPECPIVRLATLKEYVPFTLSRLDKIKFKLFQELRYEENYDRALRDIYIHNYDWVEDALVFKWAVSRDAKVPDFCLMAPCPYTAADLIAKGIPEGPLLGETLQSIRELWYMLYKDNQLSIKCISIECMQIIDKAVLTLNK